MKLSVLFYHCVDNGGVYVMASTQQVLDTGYNADSAEWCPLEGLQDKLLCGTYQLEEENKEVTEDETKQQQTRVGKLHVYQLEEKSDSRCLTNVHSVDMPGILDIKWCSVHLSNLATFGLVNSVGEVRIYQLNENGRDISKTSTASLGSEVLGLSLDWSNKVIKNPSPCLSCTSSDGRIVVYQVTQTGLEDVVSWKAHDFEAWITAYNYWNDHVVYSGGDDCKLKGWDTRRNPAHPVFSSKRHSMGVCSIQSCPLKQNLLCTGSYDENLLVWDDRNMKSPLSETGLGGGIWRVKWESHTADLILTATMYNGFHILDARNVTGDSLPVLCHYQKHESIGYGADWCYKHSVHSVNSSTADSCSLEDSSPGQMEAKHSLSDIRTVATCSFYDHCLHLWNYCFNE